LLWKQIIEQVLANLLFCPSAPALEDLEEFPAPETLKGRILISTKPPKEDEDEDKTEAIVKHHILSAEVAKLHMGKKVKMDTQWAPTHVLDNARKEECIGEQLESSIESY
jgi:hypothetical protein